MTMLMLKRLNVRLDRDVIFLAEAGEEGSSRLGIQFMANQHFDAIDAEFCYAEGGSVARTGGTVKYARIQTVEKIPRAITVTAKGIAGHGSVPLETNALVHLGEAVGAIAAWTPPQRINETTAAYFKRLADGLDTRRSGPLSRRAESRSENLGTRRRLPSQERTEPLVDAAHVVVADDDRRRVSHQRHPLRGHRQHRHPAGAG